MPLRRAAGRRLARQAARSEQRDPSGGDEARAPGAGHRAGAGARRAGEDARGLRRAPAAARALRRAPGELPPPALAAGSPGGAEPSPEPAGRAHARSGSPGLPRSAQRALAAGTAAPSRLPHSAKPLRLAGARRCRRRGKRRRERGGSAGGRAEDARSSARSGTRGASQPPQVRGRCPEPRWRSRRALHRPRAASLRSCRASPAGLGLRARGPGRSGPGSRVLGHPIRPPLPGAADSRRRLGLRLRGADKDRRCWWPADVDRGTPSPPSPRGAGRSGCPAGPSREPGAGRARTRVFTRARARRSPASPAAREPVPSPALRLLGAGSRGGVRAAPRAPLGEAGAGAAGVAGTPSRGRSASLLLLGGAV